jgi:hypothetical protein
MRLKAKLLSAHRLVDICKIIEKFGKNVDILISGVDDEKDVSFVVHGRAESSCQAWCIINRDAAFSEITCVSQNANKIGLNVEIKELVTCLRHCFNYDEVTLKLSKVSDKPVLAFEMQKQNRSILFVSNVAVTVLKASEVGELVEPSLPHPVVCLFTPPAAVLSSVVNRMANVSSSCVLSASPSGSLSLSSQTIDVSFESSWSQLQVYQVEGCESEACCVSFRQNLIYHLSRFRRRAVCSHSTLVKGIIGSFDESHQPYGLFHRQTRH